MKAARIILAILGLTACGWAIAGIVNDSGTRPLGQIVFVGAVLVGHDLVLLPIALVAGAAVARWSPAWLKGPLQAALFAIAIISVIALPFVLGKGRTADNPSALPLPYGTALLVVLAPIWTVSVAAAIRRRHKTQARPPHE